MAAPTVSESTGSSPDYRALSAVLVGEFTDVDAAQIGAIILDAHESVLLFSIPEEQRLSMVEVIARQQLRERRGDVTPAARLDPEVRVRRTRAELDPT